MKNVFVRNFRHEGFSDMANCRLGDSFLLLSWMKSVSSEIRWYVEAGGAGEEYCFNRLFPLVSHHFDSFEIAIGKPNNVNSGCFVSNAASNGAYKNILKPKFKPSEKSNKYITTQLGGTENIKFISHKDRPWILDKHSEGYEIVDLERSTMPMDEMLGLIAGAEFHIGVNSGCTWAAFAVDTPVKYIDTHEDCTGTWRRMILDHPLTNVVEKVHVDISGPRRIY